MREGNPVVVRREDYTAPAYWIRTVDLTFDLDPTDDRDEPHAHRAQCRRTAGSRWCCTAST